MKKNTITVPQSKRHIKQKTRLKKSLERINKKLRRKKGKK
jgi:hypothetical protein